MSDRINEATELCLARLAIEVDEQLKAIDSTIAAVSAKTNNIVPQDKNTEVVTSRTSARLDTDISNYAHEHLCKLSGADETNQSRYKDKVTSNYSISNTHNSILSTHNELLQHRAQLEHQISLVRDAARNRALEASRERIHQMDLEQDLVDMQRQIDELSSDEQCNDSRNVRDQREFLRKPTSLESLADIDVMAKVFADAINLNKLPAPEPPIFYGNPLEYPAWKSSFDTLIGSKRIDPGDKIHYLKRYLGGDAQSCVQGVFLFSTEAAYVKARDILQMRFGSDFAVAEAFREKLYNWQEIEQTDSDGLQRFSDFLQQCDMAKQCIKGLDCLDDCRENRLMLTKLPDYIIIKWNRIICEYTGYFPPFSTFATFILKEAKIACNPVTSLNAVRAMKIHRKQHPQNLPSSSTLNVEYSSMSNLKDTIKRISSPCRYCNMTNHKLHNCKQFIALSPYERKEYIQQKRLCFSCLEVGHVSKNCKLKKTCRICQRLHPTCLHDDYNVLLKEQLNEGQNKSELDAKSVLDETIDSTGDAKSLQASQGQSTSGMIVPVYLSSVNSPDTEVLTYALLDTQSDTTFVLSNICDKVQPTKHRSSLRLSTLTSTSYVNCFRYNDLRVRGFNSDVRIPLPSTYSTESIPVHRSHIPTSETAKQWPHLTRIHDEIPSLQNCEVGLLIGYNCPQALAPCDFICGEGNAPYAQKTKLGWSIVGISHTKKTDLHMYRMSHRIICSDAQDDVKPETNASNDIIHTMQVKFNNVPLENDTSRDFHKENILSQNRVQFSEQLEEATHYDAEAQNDMLMLVTYDDPFPHDNERRACKRSQCMQHRLQKIANYLKSYRFSIDKAYHRTRWRLPQELCSKFWDKFRIEHLNCVHMRKPWYNKRSIIGDMCSLLK